VSAHEVPARFSVAFSLAGEHRELVLPVAQEVEDILGRSTVFYDSWYEHLIAGQDADLLLQSIYGERADLVVVCISDAYGDKAWTQIEHRAIRARLQAAAGMARQQVLPVRVGNGEVPGVLVNDIVPDLRGMTVREAAELIIARWNLVRGMATGIQTQTVTWPNQPPTLHWPMADHSQARDAFASLLSASSPVRALFVQGASETGKSHMTRQMLRNAMGLPGVVCGRFDFKGTTSMGIEVEAFCAPLGLDPPPGQTLTQQLGKILTQLRRRASPTVLVLDTYEASGEVREWIEGVLLPHLVSARWLRVVIVGQSVPNRVGATWEAMADPVLTLQVPGPEDWCRASRWMTM
jgi:hypothetical protein